MRISARRAARFVRAVFPPSSPLSAPWAPAGYPRRPILPGPAATTSPRGRRVPPSHHVGGGAAPARAAPRLAAGSRLRFLPAADPARRLAPLGFGLDCRSAARPGQRTFLRPAATGPRRSVRRNAPPPEAPDSPGGADAPTHTGESALPPCLPPAARGPPPRRCETGPLSLRSCRARAARC